LTPEAQRIAIAEAHGWKKYGKPYPSFDTGEDVQWWKKNDACGECCDLPDYLNDLNAIHAAEGTIFEDEIMWQKYRDEEFRFLLANDTRPLSAAQRCECFLKAIGKWEPDALLSQRSKQS
jgi:hypothetical protein